MMSVLFSGYYVATVVSSSSEEPNFLYVYPSVWNYIAEIIQCTHYKQYVADKYAQVYLIDITSEVGSIHFGIPNSAFSATALMTLL